VNYCRHTRKRARRLRRAVMPHVARAIHVSCQGMTEFLSQTLAVTAEAEDPRGRTWTHTNDPAGSIGAHAVEFSKTVAPCREGVTFERTLPRAEALGAGPSSLAPLGGGCGLRVRPDVPAPLSGSIRTDRSRASPGRRADVQAETRSAPDPLCRKANRGTGAGATANWSSSGRPHGAAGPRARK
jgi:hypothetical protein